KTISDKNWGNTGRGYVATNVVLLNRLPRKLPGLPRMFRTTRIEVLPVKAASEEVRPVVQIPVPTGSGWKGRWRESTRQHFCTMVTSKWFEHFIAGCVLLDSAAL
ncbi:unnamed protein product, partial [Chrysoparadoxa australica]